MDGETSVSHDHGHGPHLRCGLSSPPATPLAPLTLWCRPAGGRGGGKHATMIGERSGTAARETGDSPWPWCPSSDHHTLEILAAGKGKGPPSSPSHPQTPALLLVPSGRGPTPCANALRLLECRENQGGWAYFQGREGEKGVLADTDGGKGWGQLGSQAAGRAGLRERA